MAEFDGAYDFLRGSAARSLMVGSWSDWKSFKRTSASRQWLYLYRFNKSRFAWGTTTGASDRLRRASMFDQKLTGKYDRRVDYLMLKVIHGMPDVAVFECRKDELAVDIEGALREYFAQSHCYRGFRGATRALISREIHDEFKETLHYRSLPQSVRDGFEVFMAQAFYARRVHPKNPKRTFYWGDCLEPGFLRDIELQHLEASIEQALQVRFGTREAGLDA